MNGDNITRCKLDPKNASYSKTDGEKVEAMTEEEIDKAGGATALFIGLAREC